MGEAETVGPWGSVAGQPNLLGKFQASERLCLKKHCV